MRYLAWDANKDTEEVAISFEADSPEEAAEQYAEDDDDALGDGSYAHFPITIHVRCPDGKLCLFEVRVEMTPEFHAKELK